MIKRKRTYMVRSLGFVNRVLCLTLVIATFGATRSIAQQHHDLKTIVKGEMNKGQLLEKTGYVSFFNYARNTPDWVAWELTAKEAKGYLDRKGYDFMPDQRLPKIHQVESYDYTGSGYDRGNEIYYGCTEEIPAECLGYRGV